MTSREIRQRFLDFFAERGHQIVPSAPVIPQGDPTLLFTNAGMNQFKDVFLGTGTRPYRRAADTQKCIRVSGKHNDLEEVGHDTYHHTFFEMLGNWSFGDYGKREAIAWAWELLTHVFRLPKDRLYATVYRTDEEAWRLWTEVTDIHPSHVQRFDEKDNFWEMGETGPCGPCSEIHIDLTPDGTGGALVNKGTPRVIEIWNLVFIQHNRNALGELEDLPQRHVDTGMGFERLCAVIQGKRSNYDTDVFAPLLSAIGALCGRTYAACQGDELAQVSMRVMADHVRTLTFAIADGAVPSNEDRGYVLRRILRRAARYARNLGLHDPVLHRLVGPVAEAMGDVFPEIRERRALVERVIRAEEENFNVTLDRGIELFQDIARRCEESESPEITGEEVFRLYDTFGFPVDLTALMAREHGLHVDLDGFEQLMHEQRERSRTARAGAQDAEEGEPTLRMLAPADAQQTRFVGYADLEVETRVVGVGADGWVCLERSPFYPEAGGQVGDVGELVVAGRHHRVVDARRVGGRPAVKLDTALDAALLGATAHARVDSARRAHIMRNHTATHLVHEALRRVLGTHLHQQGSLVAPDRLRFDFNHFEKVEEAQVRDIEAMVNAKIREGIAVVTEEMGIDAARKIPGVKMFFGDKYGDQVRVVTVDPSYSVEFCGGTHVRNTADIGFFKLVMEGGIASGMRRIEAVTGTGADELLTDRYVALERLAHRLNVPDREVYRRVEEVLEEKRQLEKELAKLRAQSGTAGLDALVDGATMAGDVRVVAARMDEVPADELRTVGDALRAKLRRGVGVLAAVAGGKVALVCVVTDDLARTLPAGKIMTQIASQLGGSGGGRPTMATGGGKDVAAVDGVLARVASIVEALV